MVKKSEKVPELRAHPILEKITKWVLPIGLPLLAILIGTMLYNAIIDKNIIGIVLNILSCIFILITSFFTSRLLMHLGAIKAYKEISELLKSPNKETDIIHPKSQH